MSLQAGRNSATTVDAEELSRFSAHAESWWDPSGEFATLHRFNPVRLDYIRRHVAAHFDRDANLSIQPSWELEEQSLLATILCLTAHLSPM